MDKISPLLLMPDFPDYKLLDSGNGRKLEKLGGVITDRPEPQAIWPKAMDEAMWAKADAVFTGNDDEDGGRWQMNNDVPDTWLVTYDGITFEGRLTAFRHLGCFPDQAPHWAFMAKHLKPGMKLLNLFGYSGVASLVAAKAGAEVVHVDASKKAVAYGKENAALAKMADKPIRWIVDDALAFCKREVRRGNKYHGIILDPPKYGRGPDGEKWDFFADMPALLETLPALTETQDSFVILTAYALRASSMAMMSGLAAAYNNTGTFDCGELTVRDEAGRGFSTAMWARRVSS
jgi:23S rRNA (cytosine1962-C5)-methyltransferase